MDEFNRGRRYVFAEAVWYNCYNGPPMPMEIAFSADPNVIHIAQVTPLPFNYWATMANIEKTISRMYNKDRFQNARFRPLHVNPYLRECTLDPDRWLKQLHERLSPETDLYVRGRSQYLFFKKICRYRYVKRIVIPTAEYCLQFRHDHSRSQLPNYFCAGIEVANMVYNQKYMTVMTHEQM